MDSYTPNITKKIKILILFCHAATSAYEQMIREVEEMKVVKGI